MFITSIRNSYRKVEKFIDSLSNRNEIMDYFDGKTRFEIRLESAAQIKEQLGVSNRIDDFFNAIDSAVREQFDRVFDVSAQPLDTSNCKSWDEWAIAHLLDYYKYDLKRIEQDMRMDGVFSSRNGHRNKMKLFEDVKTKYAEKRMRLSGKCVVFCDTGVISVFKVEVYSNKSADPRKSLPISVFGKFKELLDNFIK